MDRVNLILENQTYKEYLKKIEEWEQDREFCKHSIEHFLDVARIAMILSKDKGILVEKERVYAAALLHDIGKFLQYESGQPHEQGSALLAPDILKACGYEPHETEEIVEAIASHRNENMKSERNLKGLLYRADKLSRNCFACKAEAECDWEKYKKNLKLIY